MRAISFTEGIDLDLLGMGDPKIPFQGFQDSSEKPHFPLKNWLRLNIFQRKPSQKLKKIL